MLGCRTQEVRSYSYCLVTEVKEVEVDHHKLWDTSCVDNFRVYLPRMTHEGDQIFFDPYTVNDDTRTLYGYIRSVDEVVR